jgi:hypothetical protein
MEWAIVGPSILAILIMLGRGVFFAAARTVATFFGGFGGRSFSSVACAGIVHELANSAPLIKRAMRQPAFMSRLHD